MIREVEERLRTQNAELRLTLLRISLAPACNMPGCSPYFPLCPPMLAQSVITANAPILRN